jgi:hypothetical protein
MRTEIVSDGEEATLVYVVLSWAWALEISRREGRGAEPSREVLWVSGALCE